MHAANEDSAGRIERGSTRPRKRVEQRGKFLYAGDAKLYVRGVAYGTFRPGEDGVPFPSRHTVASDFAVSPP